MPLLKHSQWLPTTCKIEFKFLSLTCKIQATSTCTSETFQLGLLLWVPLPAHHVPRRGLWTWNMPAFELQLRYSPTERPGVGCLLSVSLGFPVWEMG